MKKAFITFIGGSLILTPMAMAGGITGPVNFPSAKVLPKNIRNFQYNGVYAQGNSKFDENGDEVDLGSSFDKTLTYNDLVKGEETLQDQIFAEAKINQAPGIGLESTMGKINGKVNIAVNAHAPVFAYGVNKNWTVAMVVPVIQSDLNVDVGSVSDESLQTAADYFSEPGQAMKDKLETVKRKFDNAVQDELSKNGYDKLEDRKKSELGDIQLISKYNYINNKDYRVSLLNSVTLPTGKKSDVDRLVDIGSGDEQWDVSAGIVVDRIINERFTLSGSINYIVQIEQEGEERIYEESDSSITNQVDSNTNRDLGDILQLAIAGQYKIGDSLTVQSSYSFQKKERDVYTGTKYAASNYAFLGADTDQEMEAIQLGMTFDTITLYRKKQFIAPMEVGIGYTKPIAGKNVLTDSLVSANLSVYF